MKLHLLELELRAKDISRRWQECTRATESSQISGKKLVTIDGKIWKILDCAGRARLIINHFKLFA